MLAWQGCSGFLILELDLPQPYPFKVHCFGKLCSDPKVIITIQNAFGTGLWEWPPGLGVDSWEEPQSQWWQEWLWLLIASWMRVLVTGGIKVFAVKACFIHKSVSGLVRKPTTGPQASFLPARPTQSLQNLHARLSALCCREVGGQEHLQHSVPTAARQLVNLTFFMGNFDMCSPLGFRKPGILHFNFDLGRKYYISPLVIISLKMALFCPSSLERAEQMSRLWCFSSLFRTKGPILAGSSHLCKFSLRMIHKIIGCQD